MLSLDISIKLGVTSCPPSVTSRRVTRSGRTLIFVRQSAASPVTPHCIVRATTLRDHGQWWNNVCGMVTKTTALCLSLQLIHWRCRHRTVLHKTAQFMWNGLAVKQTSIRCKRLHRSIEIIQKRLGRTELTLMDAIVRICVYKYVTVF